MNQRVGELEQAALDLGYLTERDGCYAPGEFWNDPVSLAVAAPYKLPKSPVYRTRSSGVEAPAKAEPTTRPSTGFPAESEASS